MCETGRCQSWGRVVQAELGGQWALYMLEDAESKPVAVVLPVTAGVEGSQPLPKLQEVCKRNPLFA